MKRILQMCIARWKNFIFGFTLCFVLGVLGSLSIGFAGNYSDFMYRNNVAKVVSNAAAFSPYEAIHLTVASKACESRSDYIELFNRAFEIDKLNFNRLKFNSWSLYDTSNPLFSNSWSLRLVNCELSDKTINEPLSLLVSPFHSNYETDGGFVHEIYKFQTMFEKNMLTASSGCTNFFYLPKTAADELLLDEGIAEPTTKDYESLIGRSFEFEYNDNVTGQQSIVHWSLSNIFIEDDIYLEASDTFGPFVVCYLGLPNFSGASISLKLRRSVFSDRWYLDKLNELCPRTDYVYSLNLRTTDGISTADVNARFVEMFEHYGQIGFSTGVFFAISLAITLLLTLFAQLVLFLFHKVPFHLFYAVGFIIGTCSGIVAIWYVFVMPLSWTLYFQLFSVLLFTLLSVATLAIKRSGSDQLRLLPNDNIRV